MVDNAQIPGKHRLLAVGVPDEQLPPAALVIHVL